MTVDIEESQAYVRGLLMGENTKLVFDGDGPLEGLGTPDVRGDRPARPRQHGVRPIGQYLPARQLRWTITALGDDIDDAVSLLAEVGAAWAPLTDGSEAELYVRLGATTFVIVGQPGRTDVNAAYLLQSTPSVTVEWVATDPIIYRDRDAASSAFLASTAGGIGFPMGFPHGFGTATAGTVATVHEGNVSVGWTAIIAAGAAGLTNPTLTLATTGERLAFLTTIDSGDYLQINSRDRTVLLNGVSDRSNVLNRPSAADWFEIPPGIGAVTFTGSGEGLVALNFRPGYLF